jgi:plastocyanin
MLSRLVVAVSRTQFPLLNRLIIRAMVAVLLLSAMASNTYAYALSQGSSSFSRPPSILTATASVNDANSSAPVNQTSATREIIIEWMETQSGQDRFYPDFIIADQGDTIDLTFINNDTVAHDIVIGPPYNIVVNASVPGLLNDVTGQEFTTPALNNSPGVVVTGTPGNVSATYSFVAKYAGIYEFVCTYHIQVGMIGYLVVLPLQSSSSGITSPISSNQTLTQSPVTTQVSIVPSAALNVNQPGYTPTDVTVVIGVNNTVEWTNNDNMQHTVTANDGSFDSGNMNPGATFSHTFTEPGSFAYICTYHHWMHGTVTVLSGTSGQQPSQNEGGFSVTLTEYQILGIAAFGIVALVAIMMIFARTRSGNEQTSTSTPPS